MLQASSTASFSKWVRASGAATRLHMSGSCMSGQGRALDALCVGRLVQGDQDALVPIPPVAMPQVSQLQGTGASAAC